MRALKESEVWSLVRNSRASLMKHLKQLSNFVYLLRSKVRLSKLFAQLLPPIPLLTLPEVVCTLSLRLLLGPLAERWKLSRLPAILRVVKEGGKRCLWHVLRSVERTFCESNLSFLSSLVGVGVCVGQAFAHGDCF